MFQLSSLAISDYLWLDHCDAAQPVEPKAGAAVTEPWARMGLAKRPILAWPLAQRLFLKDF